MKLRVMRHLWGVSGSWEEVFPRIKASGYDGIDAPVPAAEDHARFRALLDQYGFDYIAQVFTTGATVDDHVESFRQQVEVARTLQPAIVNSHTGKDAWSEDESARFFEQALQIEADLGIRVAHETHRGRIFFNPWITSRLLGRFDDLKLCADFSHWTCVCERMLDDQQDIIEQCAQRCIHIHARVGYEEGPQVPDPRAPEYQYHLEAHERWWGLIWDAQESQGHETTLLTPEFGPPGYLHILPYTRMPVVDLWEICDWQAQRQAANFARRQR